MFVSSSNIRKCSNITIIRKILNICECSVCGIENVSWSHPLIKLKNTIQNMLVLKEL